MVNKDILVDFMVLFLNMNYDELLDNINHFFYQRYEDRDKHIEKQVSFVDFISEELYFNDRAEENDNITELENLNQILTDDGINVLSKHLNENFTWGFPDYEDGLPYDGNFNVETTPDELKVFFKDKYLIYHNINSTIYISYLYQLFYYKHYDFDNIFKQEKAKIDNLYDKLNYIPNSLKEEYKIHYDKELKIELFKLVSKRPFQFQGFFDSKGIQINENTTFNNWLKLSNKQDFDYKYADAEKDIYGIEFMKYQYFRYKFYGESIYLGNTIENDKKFIELNSFINDNKELISFLTNKGFDLNEIKRIINVLSNNAYEDIKIRSLYFKNEQVEFFRFCYLFYIFDFLKNEKAITFDSGNDNEQLIFDGNARYKKKWNNQFDKYHKFIVIKGSNQYPFTTVDKTIDRIETNLFIKREKLKPIPKTDLSHF